MLPKVASIASYDGVKADYSAPIDSSTDRTAAGVNPAYGDVAAMTHTAFRAWIRLTLYSSGAAPTVVAHDETWNNGLNAAPVAARTTGGQFTVTYPSTVVDEIPSGSLGYTGPQALNLLAALGGVRSNLPTPTDWGDLKAMPSAPNVVSLYFWKFAGGGMTLGDPTPSQIDVDVFVR